MDVKSFEALSEVFEGIDKTGAGRALLLLVELAERGMRQSETPENESPYVDPLIGPQKVAEILGYSWKHCVEELIPRYGVQKVCGNGSGQRYTTSSIVGLIEQMKKDSREGREA